MANMAIGTIASTVFSIGLRDGISAYKGIPMKTAALYNWVDMVVSRKTGEIIMKHLHQNRDINRDPLVLLAKILISRSIGIIAGLTVTAAVFGPLDPIVAIAMNATSLFACVVIHPLILYPITKYPEPYFL